MTKDRSDSSDDPVLAAPNGTPQPGDVVLAPQRDGGCLLALHPGDWQIAFTTHDDAVRHATRYATSNSTRIWVQTLNNEYERI